MQTMNDSFQYGTGQLTVADTMALARGLKKGSFSPTAVDNIRTSQEHVKTIAENNTTVYGVNTGFGILANTRISQDNLVTLQHKILQSHSVGVGDPVPALITKIMLI